MAKLGVCGRDLFGDIDDTCSAAEDYAFSRLLNDQDNISSRTDWCFENLPMTAHLMLELEDAHLLEEALQAYILGLYSVVIISSCAFCERLLTDAVETLGNRKSPKGGLRSILNSSHVNKLLHPYVVNRLNRMQSVRNNLCHERDGNDKFRIFRRLEREGSDRTNLIKKDAKEALCIMRSVAAQIPRQFPRNRIEGVGDTPTLSARLPVR